MTQTPSPATPPGVAGLPAADPGRLASLVDLGLTNTADQTIRLTAWDQPEALPSSQITSLEQACAALDVDARCSAVLLCIDGITDRVGTDAEEQLAALSDLSARVQTRGPQAVIDSISKAFGDANDDIVALVVRVPAHASVNRAPLSGDLAATASTVA